MYTQLISVSRKGQGRGAEGRRGRGATGPRGDGARAKGTVPAHRPSQQFDCVLRVPGGRELTVRPEVVVDELLTLRVPSRGPD